MSSLLLVFGIYGLGCLLALLFFIFGSVPALNERNWPWPVIFFWPLLVFWPLHGLAVHKMENPAAKASRPISLNPHAVAGAVLVGATGHWPVPRGDSPLGTGQAR